MKTVILGAILSLAAAPLPFPDRVVNRVHDLFDGALELDTETRTDRWESAVFPTDQFTRIGLRVDGRAEIPSTIICNALWQFAHADEFIDPRPSATTTGFPGPVIDGGGEPPDFTEVRGLRAKIVCRPVYIGHGPPGPASGVLTDVKVLLRRE